MPDESRILQLLEEALDSKRTPEDVCADAPELLWEVRERWERCQNVEAQIEAIFPTTGTGKKLKRCLHLPTTLPVIPGYQINAVLGRGGMGVVYKARHLKLNRPVAIKMLLCGELASSEELTCLMREAQAVAGLTHANIVQVHDVGDLDGLPFFTMEFIEGGSLAQKLGGVPQPAREAAAMMVLLARAVHSAHQGGVVHRDLKPSNILLTSDGTPKITDFGLARQLEAGAAVSMKGARVGTPSYMSPEQAMGKVGAFCPSVDIYSLGAILYEMLTGRPPFKAETASETQRQLIAEEPVPPQRLNSKVPCDLQTICLKCLRKDPERRYASAAELADDLVRFVEGRPILARPASWAGRLWRWSLREPAAAALVVSGVAILALAIGGGFLLQRQRSISRSNTARQEGQARQAVEAALAHSQDLQKLGHWPEARAALAGAPELLGAWTPPQLREQLQKARADADMVVRLEDVRLRLSEGTPVQGRASSTADHLYTEAFASYGISPKTSNAADAAALIRRSDICDILLVFLHDWLYWAPTWSGQKVRAVVDLADDDPWRREFREARSKNDLAKMQELARSPEAMVQPPALLSGLGGALLADGDREEAWTLLRRAQRQHPADFWMNYLLGLFLAQERPQEAVGYFRAAIAIRPASDQAYAQLGRALRQSGDADGAISAISEAVKLNPARAGIAELTKALAPLGRLEEARLVWEKMLRGEPKDHDSWYGYAQLCLYLGNEDEDRRTREAILRRFATTSDWIVAERTGLASLLLPGSPEELQAATAMADRAVANALKSPEPNNPYVKFLKGLSEYRLSRFEQAIPLLSEASEKLKNRPGPSLVLAMAQFRMGLKDEARKTLAAAVVAYNWRESHDDHATVWTSHILRREAEALILPNLPAFLEGKYQPQDNNERLGLLGVCEFQGLFGTTAQLFADAFAADPALAQRLSTACLDRTAREGDLHNRLEVLNTAPRYLAARCAALAGMGIGNDVAKFSEVDRTRLRKQARDWLKADLATAVKMLDSDSPAARHLVKEMLTQWQGEQDLAGIRDPAGLETLPASEGAECAVLWNEIAVTSSRAQPSK
jgi:tetratricopeptide (TPR) repeat protein/tRNA A-37 threonylcarbamoyl transferase component Bud32